MFCHSILFWCSPVLRPFPPPMIAVCKYEGSCVVMSGRQRVDTLGAVPDEGSPIPCNVHPKAGGHSVYKTAISFVVLKTRDGLTQNRKYYAPWVFSFCLPVVTACDQTSQAFPSIYVYCKQSRWELPGNEVSLVPFHWDWNVDTECCFQYYPMHPGVWCLSTIHKYLPPGMELYPRWSPTDSYDVQKLVLWL